MQKNKYFFLKIAGCLMLTVLLLCGCTGGNDLEITTAPKETEELSGQAEDASHEQLPEAEEDAPIYVQVTGAVNHPGVYELPKGARVFEAIEKAGGMTADAKAESVNQALEVSDGQMIVLYTSQEWEQMQAGADGAEDATAGRAAQDALTGNETDDDRININTASMEQLCSISGIGESRAQSIITYREQNGEFGSIEEIMNVSGIKEGLFQKIKDKIKV